MFSNLRLSLTLLGVYLLFVFVYPYSTFAMHDSTMDEEATVNVMVNMTVNVIATENRKSFHSLFFYAIL
jgi:hypothetical protein